MTGHGRGPCAICGGSLDGKRRTAVVCGGPCRAERSRVMRILGGSEADGMRTLDEYLARRRKRTGTALAV